MRVKALKPILCGANEIPVGGFGEVPDQYVNALIEIGSAEKAEEKAEDKKVAPKAVKKK